MTIHREFRDFNVIVQSVDGAAGTHTVLAQGGRIEPGDLIETTYRGGVPGRFRVRSITRANGLVTWCATVVPVPDLRLVA